MMDTIGTFLQDALYGFSTLSQNILQPLFQPGATKQQIPKPGAAGAIIGTAGQYVPIDFLDYRDWYGVDSLSEYGGKTSVKMPGGETWIPTSYVDASLRDEINQKGVFGAIMDDIVQEDEDYVDWREVPNPVPPPPPPTPVPPPKPSPVPPDPVEGGGNIYTYSYDYSQVTYNYDYSQTTYNEAVESVKEQQSDGLFGGMGSMILMMLMLTGVGMFQPQQVPQQPQQQARPYGYGWTYS